MANVFDAIESFNKQQGTPTKVEPTKPAPPPPKPAPHKLIKPNNRDTVTPRYRDTTTNVRKAVKVFGKEAATYRFALEEKRAMQSIIFTYKQQGIHTNESQIVRIALNIALEEHKANKGNSLLDKIICELNE